LCDYVDLLGKEFFYGGRGPDRFDCYGLVREIYRRRGIELPDVQSVTDPAEIHRRMAEGKECFREIERPEPYCIVMMSVRPPYVSHVGVVLPNLYQFLHTMQRVQVCVERLDSPEWSRRIRGYFRWM
jgi:cell wall-associated NlpC family hydrolase